MGPEQTEDLVRAVHEGMGLYLLALGTDQRFEGDVSLCNHGEVGDLVVYEANGEVAFRIVGKDSVDMGRQLGLACLQNVSIEHLGALHLRPLNKPVQRQEKRS